MSSHKSEGQLVKEMFEFKQFIDKHKSKLSEYQINATNTSYLIYKFAPSKNPIIGQHVYYGEDGKIRYKVLFEEAYKVFVPNVHIENEYVSIELKEFLGAIDLDNVKRFILSTIKPPKQPEIGVGVLIQNVDLDKVLLIKRKKNPEKGKWSIPGGKIEAFEYATDAAIRETKEEVGVDITILKLFSTTETINKENNEHWISLIYASFPIEDELPYNKEPDKIEEVKWFSLDELPNEIACFSVDALLKLQNNE